jgi:NADH-quinone oxidoreductase subunit L
MTHAFFKALLFLAAGIVINALHHEHDMFRMGGLRRELPVAFWAFLAGGCALAGLPLITSGAYSKDLILWHAWSSPSGSPLLWVAGIAGVFLTSLYTFRLIFLVFFGRSGTEVSHRPGFSMKLPVWILAVFSIAAGFPHRSIANFLAMALPGISNSGRGVVTETGSGVAAGLAFAAGLLLAWFLYLRPFRQPSTTALQQLWFSGWGFDWIYDRLFVRPVIWISRMNKDDIVDSFYDLVAGMTELAYRAMSDTQTGKIRWYAAGIAAGSALFIAIAIF